MTDFEDRPVDVAVRSVARQEDGGEQPAPSTLRGATSALLRKVFRRTSAEIPHDSGSGAAAIRRIHGTVRGWCRKIPGLAREPRRLTRAAAKRLTARG